MSICIGAPLAEAWLMANYCVETIPVSVRNVRSVISVGTSDMLTLERGTGAVVLVEDTNGDGLPDSRRTVVEERGINHGMALHNGYLYASSETTVFRWQVDNDFSTGQSEVVINNMSPGGHFTRTLAFDSQGRLYVSIGSDRNIDADSFRSRIRRFNIGGTNFPIDFAGGEVFADGLRNEVGLAFDKFGVLWGVENGADQLTRGDIGGDITNDNPGEELNQFKEEDAGKHWGYPWCWSEFQLPPQFAKGAGTVWAWPTTMNAITDAQCRANYQTSALSMQAHSAPLGITFYEYKATRPSGCKGGFPKSMDGYAFIAFHGSWNRDVPTGYKVVYVKMDENGNVDSTAQDILKHQPPNARWPGNFRPVDVDFDECGRLIVTSDTDSKIVRISSTTPVFVLPCFSDSMTVELEDSSVITLKDAKIGDKVKVDDNKFEAISGFGHRDETMDAQYLKIQFSDNRIIEMSGDHMLYVPENKIVPASVLRVGNEVISFDKTSAVVTSIQSVQRKGAYAPFTQSGSIVVNGIKASNYISLQPDASHLTIAGIQTPISHHWLAHSFLIPFRWFASHETMMRWMEPSRLTAQWLLEQHPIVLTLTMLPLVIVLGSMSMFEALMVQPGVALAFWFIGCLVYFVSRSSKKTKLHQH